MISRFATRRLIDASATLDPADRALLNIWVNRGLDDAALARMTGLSVETITERRARVVSNLSDVLGLPPEHVRSALTEIAVVPDASPDTPSGPDALTAPTADELSAPAPEDLSPPAPQELSPPPPEDLPPTAPESDPAADAPPADEPEATAPTPPRPEPAAAADTPPAAEPTAAAEAPATAGAPPATASPGTDSPATGSPRRRRAWIALLAAVVVAAVVLIIVLAFGGSARHPADAAQATTASAAPPTPATVAATTTTPSPASASTTPTTPSGAGAPAARRGTERLAALPGGLADASGTVTLHRSTRKLTLDLRVNKLPPASHGHYEVWLYQSLIYSLPLGQLRNGVRRLSLVLPGGAGRYPWIDISLQPRGSVFPSGDSVLRAANPVYGSTR